MHFMRFVRVCLNKEKLPIEISGIVNMQIRQKLKVLIYYDKTLFGNKLNICVQTYF